MSDVLEIGFDNLNAQVVGVSGNLHVSGCGNLPQSAGHDYSAVDKHPEHYYRTIPI